MTSLNVLCSDHHNFKVLKECAKKIGKEECKAPYCGPLKTTDLLGKIIFIKFHYNYEI